MVKLRDIRGLGSERVELPDGQTIEYDAEAEVMRMVIGGIRSKCARCREQSGPGSRLCPEHLAGLESESRGRNIPIAPGGGGGRSG